MMLSWNMVRQLCAGCKVLFYTAQQCIVHIVFGIHGLIHTQQKMLHVTAAHGVEAQSHNMHANCEGGCMSPHIFSRSH